MSRFRRELVETNPDVKEFIRGHNEPFTAYSEIERLKFDTDIDKCKITRNTKIDRSVKKLMPVQGGLFALMCWGLRYAIAWISILA